MILESAGSFQEKTYIDNLNKIRDAMLAISKLPPDIILALQVTDDGDSITGLEGLRRVYDEMRKLKHLLIAADGQRYRQRMKG